MIQLGEQSFEVPPPYGMKSFALQQRIIPIAGRLFGALFGVTGSADLGKVGSILEVDVAKLLPLAAPALGEIFACMPPGELEGITRALLSDATCNGIKLFAAAEGGAPFDLILRGRTSDTWRLLWHAMQVWYPDFFANAGALFAGMKKASPSPVSTTSATPGPAGV